LPRSAEALLAAAATRIFAEKVSGAAKQLTNRRELERLLKTIQPGDTVLITKLDRLARSTRPLLNILHRIGEAGATCKSLGDAWADTTTPHGRLLLTMLGGIADFERELIKTRTADGRKRAIANGRKMGPRFKLSPYQQAEAIRRVNAGESMVDIGRSYNVSHATISRLAAKAAL